MTFSGVPCGNARLSLLLPSLQFHLGNALPESQLGSVLPAQQLQGCVTGITPPLPCSFRHCLCCEPLARLL